MSKKKTPAAPALLPKKTPTPRKPKVKASADSKMKKTILSAPQALQLEAANSFMRTKAFTLQNKVRTAMTGINTIDKTESNIASVRPGSSIDLSMQPSSQNPFLAKPSHRFKFAFLGLILAGALGGYFYSDRLTDGFKSSSETAGHVSEAQGTPTAPHMREETVVPATDAAPASAKTTDVIPTENAAAAPAAKVAEEPKAVKASPKTAKKAKTGKTKTTKAKAKAKSKVAHK